VKPLRIAVVGGGWAGMAAAVTAAKAGHPVTVFEATRQWGGRARGLPVADASGRPLTLDNGQHILIGAYRDSLALMRTVGVAPKAALLRLPLCMRFADGSGLALPRGPVPLDLLAGILLAPGWRWADRWSLLLASARWQWARFRCPPACTVADLCTGLTPTVLQTLIEPLCVSALNTPMEQASGQVFLRVLRDALLGGWGSSNLLLPRTDLSALFPAAAAQWLRDRGSRLKLGTRIQHIACEERAGHRSWQLDGEAFDAVVWATAPGPASQVLGQAEGLLAPALHAWAEQAAALQHEAIATVYVQAGQRRLPRPMLALRSGPGAPAQFVFDRGRLGGPAGLLAFVASASQDERGTLQQQVLQQAQAQLAPWLDGQPLDVLQTVVEKRATFACTPGLQRPTQSVAAGLWACGDYVEGPYPATLEGAVRSGMAAARAAIKMPRAAARL